MNTVIQDNLEQSINSLSASSAMNLPVPAPGLEPLCELDSRSPLKEIKDNIDALNLDQPDQGQDSEESVEKINDYVAKVLEKLTSQRNKIAKMGAVLEKNTKILNGAQGADEEVSTEEKGWDEEDAEEEDPSAKENLSPVKRSKGTPKKSMPLGSLRSSPDVNEVRSPSAKVAQNVSLEDVLQVSRTEIAYGKRFPGQIVEEVLEIVNTSDHDFIVQILVSCKNEELQDTEEYVFSVRRSHLYDYNDKHFLIMAPHSRAEFKFALKIPNMKITGTIQGEIDISIQGVNGSYILDMTTEAVLPKVSCPKALSLKGLDYKVIKLAIKEGKKSEMKIPIRNNGPLPVTLELEFYEPRGYQDCEDRSMFDCTVHPGAITIPANGTALTNIVVKPWKNTGARGSAGKMKPARKVLVGRVRDTALVYSFVFWIEQC